ncbi:tetratricopeptide repeat protein [Brucepastera parasyntrophica]|uniref:tetratricopeptide repeat protein n=1 Tax=Brucepastera parasyntrophica TaxID=2880008 RepID=UPI0021096B4E|nr:tetratricopeptide repeat protein [Brucepastera parasyntrophica]ULQ60129.1 tetratricopeptide repeat protein [Brucepastera parasyntrophica]
MDFPKTNASWLPDREHLLELYQSYQPALQLILKRIESKLKSCITVSSTPTYKGRVKTFNSYYRKFLRTLPPDFQPTEDLPTVTDILGIRIICSFLQDLTEVEYCLKSAFRILEVERKGADRTFREFGYESTHILLAIPDELKENLVLPPDLIIEVQVRTILQDAWAEVEHELVYKSEFSPFDLPLKRKLASINASLSLADIIFQEIRDYQTKLNDELDKRRGSFYHQADNFFDLDNDLPDVSSSGDAEKISETASPYVKGTIDDMILEAIEAHNNGNLERAIMIYTLIIDKKPNATVLSVIYKHRGMAYFALSRYEDALQDFNASAENNPANFRAYYYIGIVLAVMGKNAEAVENFTHSLDINLYQPYVYFRRAQAFYTEGRYTEALNDLDKSVSLGLKDENEKKLRLLIAKRLDVS